MQGISGQPGVFAGKEVGKPSLFPTLVLWFWRDHLKMAPEWLTKQEAKFVVCLLCSALYFPLLNFLSTDPWSHVELPFSFLLSRLSPSPVNSSLVLRYIFSLLISFFSHCGCISQGSHHLLHNFTIISCLIFWILVSPSNPSNTSIVFFDYFF